MAVERKQNNKRPDRVTLEGFETAPTSFRKGMVLVPTGDWDTGKTEFSLTTPPPIAFIDMDTGTRGVIEKWAREKEILWTRLHYRDATKMEEWKRMWGEAKEAFTKALEHPKIRTVVWDTATEAYELCKMAAWGKLNKVITEQGVYLPYPYGPVNEEFRDLMRQALRTDKIVILIHRTQPEFVAKMSTGNRIRSGYGDMDFITEVGLNMWKRMEKNDLSSARYGLTVSKCRLNRNIFGLELEEPLCTFPVLAAQIFPDTSEEDWI